MRAACEACSAPQPPDWQPGHFCTTCGSPTRRETRCAWCVRWTPAGEHCRHCGAELIEDELFAAARMVRDAGTDRFSVRRVLADLGPDRVADLTRIFQRHAAVLAAHVDALSIVEQSLVVRGLASRLEDEQLPLLPWPDDVLARCTTSLPGEALGSAAGLGRAERLAIVEQIATRTPFDLTRQAASVARLVLDDWTAAGAVIDVVHAPAADTLGVEAVLALTGWRARTMLVRSDLPWPSAEIDEVLRAVCADGGHRPLAARAAVRLAGLAREPDRDSVRTVLAGRDVDDDTAFDAALQLPDLDVLRAALAAEPIDPVARIAAGRVLVRAGHGAELAHVLREGPDSVVEAVVGELDRLRAAEPSLEVALVGVVTGTSDPRLAQRATKVAARSLSPAGVRRIARARLDDDGVVQALLQGSGVAPEAIRELADLLLAEGRFRSGQFGISTVAQDGRLDDRWVPTRFYDADAVQRAELMRVAEIQLGARADEALHRFVLGVVFGGPPSVAVAEPAGGALDGPLDGPLDGWSGDVRVQALWALRRWYRARGDMRGEGPLTLTVDGLAAVGWTVDDAVRGLPRLLRDDVALRDVGVFEWVAALLRSADDGFVAEAASRHHRDRRRREHPAGGTDPASLPLDGLCSALDRLAASDHWSPLVAEAARLRDRLTS